MIERTIKFIKKYLLYKFSEGNMSENEKIKEYKNSWLPKLSVISAVMPVVYMIFTTIKDIIYPLDLKNINANTGRDTILVINILIIINTIGAISAAISMYKKMCSRRFGWTMLILNSIVPILFVGVAVSVIFKVLGIKGYR